MSARPRRAPIALLGVALLVVVTVVAALASARHERDVTSERQRELADGTVELLDNALNAGILRLSDLSATLGGAGGRAGDRQFDLIARRLLDHRRLASVWYVERTGGDGWVLSAAADRLPGPAVGAAIGAVPGIRAALDTAVALGRTQATAPMSVPGGGWRAIALFTPVYHGGVVPPTAAQRRATVVGATAGVLPTGVLARAMEVLGPDGAPFEIRQGERTLAGEPLPAGSGVERTFDAAGREWVVAVGRPPAGYGLTWTIVGAGALLTVALGLLIWQAGRRERYALALVDEKMAERVAADAALHESVARIAAAEERFRTAFEAAPIGMALSDLDGRFIQVNDALCAITGYTREELEEMSFSELSHPSDVAREREMMNSLLAGEQSTYWMEKRYVDVVGQVVWVAVHATLVRAADGSPAHFLGQIQDISERIRYEAQLQHMADHDPLTGLLNRRSFERELNHHITQVQRYGPEGAALVLDIDRFKHINDTLGHNVGDELIVKVAQSLRTRLRDSDVLARLGGDEFAVLLPRGGAEEAQAVAESVLAAVRAQSVLTTAGRRRPITASVGIALFGDGPELSAEDVLVNADLAMYDAKEGGRDRAATYSSLERGASRMKARITWAERIRDALEEDRFTLYAQPIVELGSGAVRQHELLLRMLDEQGEVIPPASFIGVAERFDLMQEIDRWVVARAIRLMGEQRRAGRELVFEVNISGSSTGDTELLKIIEAELRDNAVDPMNLVLEVTETTAVSNIPRAQEFASRLAELGCRFALDDFGAGFGSFYYLKHLPFDILKIDGEFVRSCTTSQTDQLLIRAAVEIARGMGKETIAEYVGDDETVELLRELGVDYAQGFHIGRPAPLEQRLAHDCVGS